MTVNQELAEQLRRIACDAGCERIGWVQMHLWNLVKDGIHTDRIKLVTFQQSMGLELHVDGECRHRLEYRNPIALDIT